MRKRLLLSLLALSIFLFQHLNAQNNSYYFNGNAHVNIGNTVIDGIRTFEFWFNLDNSIDPTLSQFEIPMQRNKLTGLNEDEFAFAFNYNQVPGSGRLRFKLNDSRGRLHEVFSDTNAWAASVWHHAAAVIDSVNGLMLFIDGKLQQSKDTTWTNAIGSSSDIVVIGCNGSAYNYYFDGKIDEVRFSTSARYTSNFIPSCSLVSDQNTRALYNFDTISGLNTAIDSSSNSYNGTTSNISINVENSCDSCFSFYDSLNVVSCGAYLSPSSKYTWTQSGSYNDTLLNSLGCDSILTVELTIDSGSSAFLYDTSCVTYTAPSGKIYSSGGLFYDTIPNVNNCDSILTIFLTLFSNTNASISVNSCTSYVTPSGKTIANSGNFNDTIPNNHGCDSIISINLSIDTISSSVTVNGNNIIANQNNVNYQWLDCNNNYAVLANDTNQSFSSFYSGSYAVEVSNSCVDTSSCILLSVVGIEDLAIQNHLTVTPNPSKDGVFTFSSAQKVESVIIYSLEGKQLERKRNIHNKIYLNDYASGLYILRFIGENFDIKKKVIIEN